MADHPTTPTIDPGAALRKSPALPLPADSPARSVSLGPVTSSLVVPEVQLLYARILRVGVVIGMALLVSTFAIYATGLRSSAIPVDQMPKYWSMSAKEYLEATNRDFLHQPHPVTGWSWLALLGKADYLNFVGITLLSAVTIVCFLGIIPMLLRKKDWVYAVMALLEALILILAASSIVCCGE